MTRAEPGIRAPGPALTTTPFWEEWHVMATRNSNSAKSPNPVLPPDPYSDDAWSWAFVIFRSIPHLPGYGIDTDGDFWSCWRNGRWQKISTFHDRHTKIMIRLKGKPKSHRIHRLVLETFIGPCPEGMEGLHKNGNSRDNRLCNLRWGTHLENARDAIRHGVIRRGESSGMAKLTEVLVREIKILDSLGVPFKDIARRMNVHPSHVSRIVNGKTWKHIEFAPEHTRR
jgi:HNH endonuclease